MYSKEIAKRFIQEYKDESSAEQPVVAPYLRRANELSQDYLDLLAKMEGKVLVPKKLNIEEIKRMEAAYAGKRHPSRWDGPPWGEAGRKNHRAALRSAYKAMIGATK